MVQNCGCSDEKNTTVIMQVIKRTADNINKVTKYQLKKEMHTTIWLGNEEPLQKFLQFSFLPRLLSCGLEIFSQKYMRWRIECQWLGILLHRCNIKSPSKGWALSLTDYQLLVLLLHATFKTSLCPLR